MRNRLGNDHMTLENEAAGQSFQVDRLPGVRVFLLGLILVVPLLAVSGRLLFIQMMNAEHFYSQFGKTTESFESIPSRDGRIVSIDGRVLALDVERFDLQAHYRWLEEPPNPRWLKQQALTLLEPVERRNREKVEAAQEKVLARRQQLWDELAQVMKTSSEELQTSCRDVQRRVETIIESVNERAAQKEGVSSSDDSDVETQASAEQDQLQKFWTLFKDALTRPPRRPRRERIVVREELDYHTLASGIPREIALAISAHPERFPGIHIQVATLREYPQKTLAPHEIGIRHRIDEKTLKSRQQRFPEGDPLDYKEGDRIGKMGVERTYDRYLRGLRGLKKVVRNRQGEIIRTEIIREPKSGDDVVLTLNTGLQVQVQDLLDESLQELRVGTEEQPAEQTDPAAGGCIVVLDVRTGAIVATASAPRYDLNLLLHPTPEEWQAVLNDPRRPLFPRATQMMLPPGSTFKALTSIALMESGKVDPDEPFICRGYLDRPDRHRDYIYRHYGVGHNELTLTRALRESCNVYFFQAARTMGPEAIHHWADQLGFGKPTGIDIPGERGGHLPDPSPPKSEKKSPWYPGDTLGMAIGQSRLTVTPLQIARLMAVVANDGEMVVPHLAHSVVPSAESSTTTRQMISYPRRYVSGIHPGTLERVREGLIEVVAHPRGTGYKTVRLKEVTIAGKTGTAENGGGKNDHAWFAGFVPAQRPKYAFAVVIEHGGSGSRVAGPVAQKLVRAMLDTSVLQPTQPKLQAN
ncbi:peptidoglycan D,D-transpeptidase FtsI family protein [Gimesia chilikensis]|uniref:peptidoglycan D,D-transpeptidase FtsI family protein n=1 Tax=Gimesia chilikensis TaxID=2605989 RepID=UPI00118A5830|nr:penicillin-binding transpeptidase domain-containing protein [Gimesia chilikensis]QDT82918.1 Penicillin-binding protein A [Gimesia chilikensis]